MVTLYLRNKTLVLSQNRILVRVQVRMN